MHIPSSWDSQSLTQIFIEMDKFFFLKYDSAAKAAEAYANEHNCFYGSSEISADSKMMQGCDYDDDSVNLSWDGEVSAIVLENYEGEMVAIFAYWE